MLKIGYYVTIHGTHINITEVSCRYRWQYLYATRKQAVLLACFRRVRQLLLIYSLDPYGLEDIFD